MSGPPSTTPEYQPYQPAPGQFGYRSTAAARRSDPRAGWVLAGAGLLLAVAAALPWATTSERSIAGTEGDGAITLVIGVLIVGLAVMIARGQGRLWVGVTAGVLSALTTLTAAVDINNVAHFSTDFADSALAVSVGLGLWLTMAAALVAVAASVVAIIRRSPLIS